MLTTMFLETARMADRLRGTQPPGQVILDKGRTSIHEAMATTDLLPHLTLQLRALSLFAFGRQLVPAEVKHVGGGSVVITTTVDTVDIGHRALLYLAAQDLWLGLPAGPGRIPDLRDFLFDHRRYANDHSPDVLLDAEALAPLYAAHALESLGVGSFEENADLFCASPVPVVPSTLAPTRRRPAPVAGPAVA